MAFIHGAVSFDGSSRDDVRAAVEKMLGAVAHHPWRATDVAVHAGDRATCVLAVQSSDFDGAEGRSLISRHQPTGQSVAADVRLHDRTALARQLHGVEADAGRTDDADLLLGAFRRWGADAGRHLMGDGVFAVWDPSQERLFCSRDVAGVRPLYYHFVARRRFVFSSDLRALAAHPLVSQTMDLRFARSRLELGETFYHPSRTLFETVRKLPAAHHLTVDGTRCVQGRYWHPAEAPDRDYREPSDYIEELRSLLGAAVDGCVASSPSEGGIGAHLSGGLDSSSLAVLASRSVGAAGRPVTGLSWAPPWEVLPRISEDERLLVEEVSVNEDLPVHFATARPDDVIELARRDIATRPTTTLFVEIAASQWAAKAGMRTLVSGWGGDELVVFNGRGYFSDLARRGRWRTLQRELRFRSQRQGASTYKAWRTRVTAPLLPNRLYSLARPSRPMLPYELRPEFARQLLEVEPLPQADLRERPGVRRMQVALLTNGHLQYRMESWAAHGESLGIRYAFPLLDKRLIEFALSIPDHLYFHQGWKRWLYRTAMEGILPDSVRWHPRKNDDAMLQQVRQVRESARPKVREMLYDRRDNPYIDVDRLLSVAGSDPHAAPDAPVGIGAWLAYTSVRLP